MRKAATIVAVAALLGTTACTNQDNTTQGALSGGAIGGAIGLAATAVGAAAGAYMGCKKDGKCS